VRCIKKEEKVKIKFSRFGTVSVLLFIVSLVVFPVTTFAQDGVENKDITIGTSGSGPCDYCTEDYCGCDPGTFNIGAHLTAWECTCGDSRCSRTCYYGA
jgi:hypothetical protein